MRCKPIQMLISSGEELSRPQEAHVAKCPVCSEHARFNQQLEAQLQDLRVQAPESLRSALLAARIHERPNSSRVRFVLAVAVFAIIALPLVPILRSRIAAHGQIGPKIGTWPTYHVVTERYQVLSDSNPPEGAVEEIDEEWVRPDGARSIRRVGQTIVNDDLIQDRHGLPVKVERTAQGDLSEQPDGNGYYFSPDGKVKQDPAASASFSPFSEDLRWLVDVPHDFDKLTTFSQPDVLRLTGTDSVAVNRETVVSANGESKVVAYRDPTTGKTLYLEHFDTVRDEQGRVVARLSKDFAMTFDYEPSPPNVFETSSLEQPTMSSPATRVQGTPVP